MRDLWDSLNGLKTHIGVGIGIFAILAGHFGNMPIPGFEVNHHTWLQDIWQLGMVSAVRHALSTRA